MAFVPPVVNEDFVPEHTPLPQLAGFMPPARAATPPPLPPMAPAGRAPTPPPIAGGNLFAGAKPVVIADSTENLLAINRQHERKRWLMIGGIAAGASLLLLVIVLAASGGKNEKSASAATPPPAAAPIVKPPPAPPPSPPKPAVAAVKPAAADEPGEDAPVSSDPNAAPVVGSGPCRISVNSSPTGSMVSIDDQPLGPSPLTFAGTCAKHKVDVKHPRYALGTKWVAPTDRSPATVDLALARPTHTVMISSTPSGATVSIAGRRAGTTPTAVKVMGFTGVSLTVEKKGFKTVTQKLYSKVDNASVTIALVRGK
jgi:hypothetical protein